MEVRFVVDKEDGIFYDSVSRENGYSKTGRTFRSSYFSLMQFYIPSERKKNDEDEFHKMRDENHTVEFFVDGITYDKNVVVLSIALPSNIICRNKHPHITFLISKGVKAVYSNDLLNSEAGTQVNVPSSISSLSLKGFIAKAH